MIGHSDTPDSAVVAALEAPEAVRAVVAISPRVWENELDAWRSFVLSSYAAATKRHRAGRVGAPRRSGGTAAADAKSVLTDRTALRSRLTAPVRVVVGTKNPPYHNSPEAAAAYALGFMQPTGIVLVADAGYNPHIEQPEVVADSIVSFLKEVGLRGSARA